MSLKNAVTVVYDEVADVSGEVWEKARRMAPRFGVLRESYDRTAPVVCPDCGRPLPLVDDSLDPSYAEKTTVEESR